MKNPYPDSLSAIQSALAFEHDPREVEAVRWALSLPKRLRTAGSLVKIGRRFGSAFLKKPVRVYYTPKGADTFNHTRRIVHISKPEMVRLLHEMGHAKYGESEESAVAYSLGLILKAKPEFVPILTGHVLENDPY